ncbi:hypothetical protein I7I48_06594 [Histoplasma ohiense]|nr:hypothetical protein I7I48_06594 [Histoplasma ohiense (nom. inval.)]
MPIEWNTGQVQFPVEQSGSRLGAESPLYITSCCIKGSRATVKIVITAPREARWLGGTVSHFHIQLAAEKPCFK